MNDGYKNCKQCGAPCERERWDWATPVCYACLPPPAPIPKLEIRPEFDAPGFRTLKYQGED